MNFKELLKLHTLKRLPAIITAVLLTAVFGLYYVGVFDISFIERPESWKNNYAAFTEMLKGYKKSPTKGEEKPADDTDAADTSENNNTQPLRPGKNNKPSNNSSNEDDIIIDTVSAMAEKGYSLTSKVWDESCVLAKLTPGYAWPKAFSYGDRVRDREKFTYYDDGTETKREIERVTEQRPALETYMGYIFYDDRGELYIIGPDGGVMTKYDDTAYMPAYTRDKEGRPLFYKTVNETVKYPTEQSEPDENGDREWLNTADLKIKSPKYYYLSPSGQYFIESDYNDATDNRGLYFDYPVYYGNSDSDFKRYYFNTTAVVTSLKNETAILNRMNWAFSQKPIKMDELSFDKDGINLAEPGGKSLTELFPFTMAYNYREGYAAVKADINWDYEHEIDDGNGGKKNEYVEVKSNELRVVDKTGKVMFNSRKNYFSELGWTANERFCDPLSLGIDSIGSYYFDHGLMRLRIQSYDRYYFTDLKMMFIVSDDDVLVRPDGTKFNIPGGFKLKAYSDGILLLENKDGTFRYMKSDGTWLKDKSYSDGKTFLEGLAVCAMDGKYGIITNTGKIIVPFEYDYISTVSSGTLTAFKEGDGWTVFQKLAK